MTRRLFKPVIFGIIICFTVMFLPYAGAAQQHIAISPALLKQALVTAGVEAQETLLEYQGGSYKAISFQGPEEAAVHIGFPQEGIQEGVVFPINIDGIELGVTFSEDAGLSVFEGEAEFVSQGIITMVDCILKNVIEMVTYIDGCEIDVVCIVEAAIVYSVYISLCTFQLL